MGRSDSTKEEEQSSLTDRLRGGTQFTVEKADSEVCHIRNPQMQIKTELFFLDNILSHIQSRLIQLSRTLDANRTMNTYSIYSFNQSPRNKSTSKKVVELISISMLIERSFSEQGLGGRRGLFFFFSYSIEIVRGADRSSKQSLSYIRCHSPKTHTIT